MALNDFTASTDFANKGKRLSAWYLSAGGVALVVNFRDGGASGTIKFQIQIPVNSSDHEQHAMPLVFVNSLYVQVVSGTLNAGAVDLV